MKKLKLTSEQLGAQKTRSKVRDKEPSHKQGETGVTT